MAKVTLNNPTAGFIMWYNEVVPQSADRSVDTLNVKTPNDYTLIFRGGPFAYDSQGMPLSGNVDSIAINFPQTKVGGVPDILIEDVNVGLNGYAGLFGNSSAVEKTSIFWSMTLSGNDTINLGTSGETVQFAGDGYVAVSDTAGDDIIRGSIGNGIVAGDHFDLSANRTLFGGNDDIKVTGSSSSAAVGDAMYAAVGSKLFGGNDVIRVGDMGATVYGDVSNSDGLVAGGDDTIWGGAGKDYLIGDVSYSYRGIVKGGDDVIHGGAGDDGIYGDYGAVIEGLAGGGADKLYGDAGHDTIGGNEGNDSIDGGSHNDLIYGNAGNDWLRGGTGQDSIYGGNGIDTADYGDRKHKVEITLDVYGKGTVKVDGKAEDMLDSIENVNGGSAGDTISGYAAQGDNRFDGRAGNDTLSGGAGEDTLIGGKGRDKLTGGADADRFTFNATGSANVDTITDFKHGTDEIALDDAIFKALGSRVTSSEFVALSHGHAATNASQHIIYDKSNGTLWYDADGNGYKHAAVQFAQLGTSSSHPANLTWDDFAIV